MHADGIFHWAICYRCVKNHHIKCFLHAINFLCLIQTFKKSSIKERDISKNIQHLFFADFE